MVFINSLKKLNNCNNIFGPSHQQAYVRAYPAVDKNVPMYILGSSTDSAHLAARKGLPYVFCRTFCSTTNEGSTTNL